MMIWVFASVGTHSPIPAIIEVTAEASVYGKELRKHEMSNGELFIPEKMTFAHRSWPLGSIVLFVNEATGEWVVAELTDRGPFIPGRVIDVSSGVAKKISLKPGEFGTAPVKVYVLKWGDNKRKRK